jgi:hypothetical protein
MTPAKPKTKPAALNGRHPTEPTAIVPRNVCTNQGERRLPTAWILRFGVRLHFGECFGDTCNNPLSPSRRRPPLAGREGEAAARFHVGEPVFRSNRAAHAFGLAQGGIGQGLVERFAQERREIADPLQRRRDGDEIAVPAGDVRRGARPSPIPY